jgi:hypothetical protein
MVWLGKFKLDADKLATEEELLDEDAELPGDCAPPPQPLRIMHARAIKTNMQEPHR